jgi:hypothetical protein
MLSFGIAAFGFFLYLTGQYVSAFWLIVLSILSGLLAVSKAVVDPDWYANERMKAGLDVDIFNPRKGIVSLIVTKIILMSALLYVAWMFAKKAGYL